MLAMSFQKGGRNVSCHFPEYETFETGEKIVFKNMPNSYFGGNQ
jgi:hypothetical protein